MVFWFEQTVEKSEPLGFSGGLRLRISNALTSLQPSSLTYELQAEPLAAGGKLLRGGNARGRN
jgi:hypothetical protein